MGSFTAIAGSLRTHRSGARDRNGSASLPHYAKRPELLHGDSPADRDDIPCSLDARGRQQALLARLVATFTPGEADRIASQLLATFGSLGQVLSASASAVRKATGHNELADVILLTKRIVLEAMREDLRQSVFLADDQQFNQFVIASLGNSRQEKMLAIFLDSHARYISDEVVATGGWSEVQLRVRSLLRRAIELDSARIVLCHNHPSGRAEPSKRDIEFTERLVRCAGSLGIAIVDHLIVAGPRVCSMRAVGAMR
jgi:DNA repair protein RadC